MANLQKIIKVTQAQYDVLASGGRVGDYVGLDDNYVYFIEDTNTYLTTAGGTITGNLTVEGDIFNPANNGLKFYAGNDHDFVYGISCDQYGGEIIYLNDGWYSEEGGDHPVLFATGSDPIIYAGDGNYFSNFTFNSNQLTIIDGTDTGRSITFDASDRLISTELNDYYLPVSTGTLATTDYVVANPQTTTQTLSAITINGVSYAIQSGTTITINTTTGSESISDGTNTLNVATRDTVQDITGQKTIKDTSLDFGKTGATGNAVWHLEQNQYQELIVSRTYNGIKDTKWHFNDSSLIPNGNNTGYLGSSSKILNTAYINTLKASSLDFGDDATITKDSSNRINLNYSAEAKIKVGSAETTFKGRLGPDADNTYDIGRDSVRWKDVYIAGNLNDGTNSISIAQLANNSFFGASAYDATATYAVGDKVLYQNKLYKCNTTIETAEAWDSSHWTEITIADYVDLTSDQTIGGVKTFTAPLNITFGNYTYKLDDGNFGQLYIGNNNAGIIIDGGTLRTGHLAPQGNNSKDIGTSTLKYKDIYLSGAVKVDTLQNSSGSTYIQLRSNDINFTKDVIANSGTNSLGSSTYKWKDLYLSGNISDGTNSITIANIQEKVQIKRFI